MSDKTGIGGAITSLADIGVSTGTASGGASDADAVAGKLKLDVDKLTDALTDNRTAAKSFLTDATNGIAAKLTGLLDPVSRASTGLIDVRANEAGDESSDIDDRIAALEARLAQRQERLTRAVHGHGAGAGAEPVAGLLADVAARLAPHIDAQLPAVPADLRNTSVPPTPTRPMPAYAPAPNAYRESAVLTASPGAARRDALRRRQPVPDPVLHRHARRPRRPAGEKLRRAEAIIDELLATLDMSVGEVAERLQALYLFFKEHLMSARLKQDAEKVDEVARFMRELRASWATIAGA